MKADTADESLAEGRNASATREFWSKAIRKQVRAICKEKSLRKTLRRVMPAYIGDDTKPTVEVSSEGPVPTIEVRASQT